MWHRKYATLVVQIWIQPRRHLPNIKLSGTFGKRAIEDQAAEAVRDLALAELELPAGAEAVTSKLIPLLGWSTLSYDTLSDQVCLAKRT